MRNFILIVLALSVHHQSSAQREQTIELVPNIAIGEIKTYTVKREIIVEAENEPKVKNSITKEIVIEVIDITRNQIFLNWRVDKHFFVGESKIENPFSLLANDLDKDLSVKFSIDKNGANIKILNIDEIAAIIQLKIKRTVFDIADKNQISKEKAELLLTQLTMMYSTPEQVKSICLSDIFKFYQLYGFSFSSNKITKIPDNISAETFNRLPANNLELKIVNFDEVNGKLKLEGELKSIEKEKKLREFIEKSGTVKSSYEFQLPENWPIVIKEIISSDDDHIEMNSIYEIRIAE